MQLIEIDHIRCNEWAASTYAWAPDDWSDDQIKQAVKRAQDAYLKALVAAKQAQNPPNNAKSYSKPPYAMYPDKTVAEVIELHEEAKRLYAEWEKSQRGVRQRFGSFLEAEGFTAFGEGSFKTVEADWGHMHGTPIEYDAPVTDASKSPYEVQTGEDPYDEF